MSKYRVISGVFSPDPDNPGMGTFRRRELDAHSADEARGIYRAELLDIVSIDPFPVAFRVRVQELRADNRYHDLHSASY